MFVCMYTIRSLDILILEIQIKLIWFLRYFVCTDDKIQCYDNNIYDFYSSSGIINLPAMF